MRGARVLREDGSAFPNLFPAGGAARGVFRPVALGLYCRQRPLTGYHIRQAGGRNSGETWP